MGKRISRSILVMCCGALLVAGCAHKEPVKPSEPVGAAQPPVAATPEERPEQAAPTAKPAPTPLPETRTEEAGIQPEQAPEAAQPGALGVELQQIYFGFDSAALSPEARETLSGTAQYLARNSGVQMRIEGHCDERGSDEYNMALGERRAHSAREYLARLGVAPERLHTISYGEEQPADPGHGEAAWTKNRRAEFVIIR